jgi:hypothetical protein
VLLRGPLATPPPQASWHAHALGPGLRSAPAGAAGPRRFCRPAARPPGRDSPWRRTGPGRGGRGGGRFRRFGPLLGRGICASESSDRLHAVVAPGALGAAGLRGRWFVRELWGGRGGRWRSRLRAGRRYWRARATAGGEVSAPAGLRASRSLRSGSASLAGAALRVRFARLAPCSASSVTNPPAAGRRRTS